MEGPVTDDPLQELMEQLGGAVYQSLSDAPVMAEAIDDIKRAGYTVALSVDVTFSPSSRNGDLPEPRSNAEAVQPQTKPSELTLNDRDEVFLRALNIAV